MTVAATSNPTLSMEFRCAWRPAQVRVLETLERHLDDRKLYVVAPPGSGKTILGLELFRRLGRPAVAFSPTRTIQSQWIGRLGEFLDPAMGSPPVWASFDLDNPGYFTSVTYQALHTRFRSRPATDPDGNEEVASPAPTQDHMRAVATRLRTLGVRTIILDEAHHLR